MPVQLTQPLAEIGGLVIESQLGRASALSGGRLASGTLMMSRFCLLVRRMASSPGAQYFSGQLAEFPELRIADAAAGEANADPEKVALLLLVDAEMVRFLVGGEVEIGVPLRARRRAAARPRRAMRSTPQSFDEEFEARAVALQPVAVIAKDFADRFDDRPDLLRPEEIWENLREMRRGGQAAADLDAVADLFHPIDRALQAEDASSQLISGCAQWMQQPETLILYLRGRLENSRLSVMPRLTSCSSGVASMNLLRIDPSHGAADDVARDRRRRRRWW